VTPPAPDVLRFSHAAMATVFEVFCVHQDAAYAGQAAHAGFALVDRLEQEMSRFIANSDVARINHLGAGETTRVGPSVIECVEIARFLFDQTGGTFDVARGTGLHLLEIDPDACTVRARAAGVSLDLGGIGKGYAVDLLAELLLEWEVGRVLVHGGQSSVRALEPPPDRDGWPVTLSAPHAQPERVFARIAARRLALSASGTRKGDHVVDPRSGLPVRGRAAWAAIATGETRPDGQPERPAALAEGLSTAFMILPVPEVAAFCEGRPGVEAWIAEGSDLTHLPAVNPA
jgi:thiamine biosynthesis lipoprotein